MFSPKLCKVIIESSLIGLGKKIAKIKEANCVATIYFNRKTACGILTEANDCRLVDAVVRGGSALFF